MNQAQFGLARVDDLLTPMRCMLGTEPNQTGSFINGVLMTGLNLLQSSRNAAEIETQIERLGIALGINWDDAAQVQALAKEALYHSKEALAEYEQHQDDYRQKAKIDLFGLANLMMKIMKDSADEGIHTHGGAAWKSFSRALMREMD